MYLLQRLNREKIALIASATRSLLIFSETILGVSSTMRFRSSSMLPVCPSLMTPAGATCSSVTPV